MALANGNPRHDATTSRSASMRQQPLHRAVYPFRILGMGLSGLPVGAVLWQLQAPVATWVLLAFVSLLWPHLALLLSVRSAAPERTERRNLLVDSAIAGLWAPLMHFNLLPSALIVTLATVDKINTGVRGLWWRSLPGMLGAAIAGGLWTGFAFAPITDMPVIVACMPILLIHTVAVSLNGYRLVRRVHEQNRRLDELSHSDPLTGLDNRRSWEQHAQRLLQRCRDGRGQASLLMVDVDGFKAINDGRGHAIGDDVLLGVADALRACIGEYDRAGRYGGDEFVVAMAVDEARAVAVAECIRTHVRNLAFPGAPGLHCTVSLGVAGASRGISLRRGMVAADAAVYRATDEGRDRVAARPHRDFEGAVADRS
jgi:diguanylate cyclase